MTKLQSIVARIDKPGEGKNPDSNKRESPEELSRREFLGVLGGGMLDGIDRLDVRLHSDATVMAG